MASMRQKSYMAALNWQAAQGADEALGDAPVNRTQAPLQMPAKSEAEETPAFKASQTPAQPLLARSDVLDQALAVAREAENLEQLREAINAFEGISLKKTATQIVFSDGNPEAPVMLVGEAPGADEDREGRPFVGVSGQLLDKILKCIDLDRHAAIPQKAVYISNILNWRPPGNRTPSPGEIEASLPFIERHIMLVKPKVLILCGGVSAKALLGRSEGISRLRGRWQEYTPQTPEFRDSGLKIPAIATYHPSYLLRTPSQKKAVWQDMLMLKSLINNNFSL